MPNPLSTTIDRGESFVYFHTHAITEDILAAAVESGTSLEVDLSCDSGGDLYIGHPESFYEFKGIPMTANLPLAQVLDAVEASDLLLVLDCKDPRALPEAERIVRRFGSDRCAFHSWVQPLLFHPYPAELTVEPHWPFEDLPLEPVRELGAATGVPLLLSCRGLTPARLESERAAILNRIISVADGTATAVNLNLPGGEAPPAGFMEALLDKQIQTLLNIDIVPAEQRPEVFLGATDHLDLADPVRS